MKIFGHLDLEISIYIFSYFDLYLVFHFNNVGFIVLKDLSIFCNYDHIIHEIRNVVM
jgi:hypothetical protein